MTYLIQDNVAHFYNRANLNVQFKNAVTVYVEGHSLTLIKTHNVKKVIDVPFKLNKEFKA